MNLRARLVLTCAAPLLLAMAPTSGPAVRVDHDGLKKLAWQLAVPTGVLADKKVEEAIEILHGLGVHHLELTRGKEPMSAAEVIDLMGKLKATHMDVVSYGPVDLGKDEATDRAAFALAKQLKAKDLIASPKAEDVERLDKLAGEYGVNLALRGMATADVLKAVEGRSARTGAYLDVTPSSLDDVKALKGHVVQVRITGGDVSEPMTELRKQGFKGVVTAACAPAPEDKVMENIAGAINALSDAVTKAAANR